MFYYRNITSCHAIYKGMPSLNLNTHSPLLDLKYRFSVWRVFNTGERRSL